MLLMATQQYVIADAQSRLPYPNFGGPAGVGTTGGGPNTWDDPARPGWLYTWPNYGNTPDDMKTGTLWKYVSEERVYHCPRQDPPEAASAASQKILNITSYIVNIAVYGLAERNPAQSYGWTKFRSRAEQCFSSKACPTAGTSIAAS